MQTPKELEDKFCQALQSDMTMMLGLDGVQDSHVRPMTAQLDGEHGPIGIFAGNDNVTVGSLGEGSRAIVTFTSKGHDLFASLRGNLSADNNRAVIDRIWNSAVAAYYQHGKEDPNLGLLRLNAETAGIWENDSTC